MRLLAINGSPRKKWNTATLLEKSVEGAAAQGAETELVHLYDLKFKGCTSCFACKTKDGESYGRCGYKDDLTPVLEKAAAADALLLGSPIYFGSVTGEMQSFLERLQFPFLSYTDPPVSIFPGKLRTGFIFTLGATEEMSVERGFVTRIEMYTLILKMIFENSEYLACFDTTQFEDYGKVYAPRFDPQKKAKRRAEVFPKDCERAFNLGKRLVSAH
jgi:multimeric flavodoxin WrbA